MSESQQPERQPLLRTDVCDNMPVYPIIHMIRADVVHYIDTPLTYEALTSPDLTYTLVRPLVEKYVAIQREGNLSVVFCCLINRVHFLRDDNLITQTISHSRANLCDILATRIFRDNANDDLKLAIALTTSWPVYSGADPLVISQAREERDDDLEDYVGNAIEMAILGKAKWFIKSSACQKVVDGIWTGKCVYQAQSSHSILSDTYKRTPIHFYDPHKAPLLDHYRLKVPSIRAVLEYVNFIVLFVLFIIALELNQKDQLNMAEICFMVFGLGFTLEKVAAMQEHGIHLFFKGTWNGFDLAFVTTFCLYAFLRIYGVYHDRQWSRSLGVDVLAMIACLMFPRLAFVTFKDSLLVLSLRAMIVQFTLLMLIAAFCFCGFLYALWTLSRDDVNYGPGLIAWWMLDLWFGLDASGFDNATKFHPVFGPILVVTYACLSNTLLLTVLVSILSNTFASVNEDAAAEVMFRKAVSTIEGSSSPPIYLRPADQSSRVKADFLFSYQPPINLVALCILLPASYILSPRWFHKLNVFMIRLTNFPILLSVSFYERQSKIAGTTTFAETIAHVAERVFDSLPRSLKRMTFFEGLAGADADIDAVFEIEEEFDSALDTGDNDDVFSIQRHNQQRRPSGGSSRRGRPYPPASPTKTIPQRTRLYSVLHQGQSFSPLAQVFNPVVVEDDNVPDHMSGHSVPPGVSFGPATRRRLTSVAQPAQRRVTEPPASQVVHSHPMKRFPTMGDKNSPPDNGILRSRSQDHYPRRQPIPAGEVEEGEDSQGENAQQSNVLRRLEDIDKRQKNIESLLMEISQSIRSSRT